MTADLFDPERSNFTRRMAAGHVIRCGHVLTGYYVSTADAGITKLVRTCCGEHEGSNIEHFPTPDSKDRILAPSGQCLNFGCPCRPEDHPVIYVFAEEDYPHA